MSSLLKEIPSQGLSIEEKKDILLKAHEAAENNDIDTMRYYLSKIPVSAEVGRIIKCIYGVEEVQGRMDLGFDFSLSEKKYGKDWLSNDIS